MSQPDPVDPSGLAAAAITVAIEGRSPHASPPADQVTTLAEWAVRIVAALRLGGTLFTFGNGGSAADAEHLAAELVGRYDGDRRALAAVALTTNTAAITAIANDYGFERVFARQIHALAGPGDVVLGITTSGKSANVLAGLDAAGDVGADRLALVGSGATVDANSVLVVVPGHTPAVQEAHRLVWHLLCVGIDALLDAPLGERADPATVRSSRAVSIDEAVAVVEGWREAGHRVATTNGCFDLLHEGHLDALGEARRQADHLVVLCNTDASVARAKGPTRPVMGFEQRVAVLAALRSVDLVVPLDADVPNDLLVALRPDVHVKGSEYSLEDLPEAHVVVAAGGRVHLNAMVPGFSTTALLADDDA